MPRLSLTRRTVTMILALVAVFAGPEDCSDGDVVADGAYGLGLLGWVLLLGATGGRPRSRPESKGTSSVYREAGRFAGWPANHGMWSWGDEILVGFSRGYYKDRGPFHHINKEKPEEFLLARSHDGGRPGRSNSRSRRAP